MKITTLTAPAAAVCFAALLAASPAAANPPVFTDDTGHVHHVMLPGGECLQIDAVSWDAVDSGMHRGANSSTAERGPWHGPCPG